MGTDSATQNCHLETEVKAGTSGASSPFQSLGSQAAAASSLSQTGQLPQEWGTVSASCQAGGNRRALEGGKQGRENISGRGEWSLGGLMAEEEYKEGMRVPGKGSLGI